MRKRLIVIGIDSLDPAILDDNRDSLPTFSSLADEKPRVELTSVFPVDTIPAWSTIHTGLNPANHGLLYSYDVFDPKLQGLSSIDGNRTREKTFWDYASKEGRRCAVLFPMLAFPPWPVNGLMISRSPTESRVDGIHTVRTVLSSPPEALNAHGMDDWQADIWGGYPGLRSLGKWAEAGREVLTSQAEIGLRVLTDESWDVFFVYFHILDVIQHRLWRFHDMSDPLHENRPELSKLVVSFYASLDDIVSKFLEGQDDAAIIVLSDHGHRSRPYVTVNINEVLRRRGYIKEDSRRGIPGSKTKMTRMLEGVLDRLNMEHLALRLMTSNQILARAARNALYPSNMAGEEGDVARLSSFLGVKSYSCGGVSINALRLPEGEYDSIRRNLIEELRHLTKEDSVTPIMKWVCTREQLYPDGRFTKNILPDIVFELDDAYSVGWDTGGDIFGCALDHKIASGGHSSRCVFLHRNLGREFRRTSLLLPDIAPTILDVIGVDSLRYGFDGKSAFRE